MSLIERTLLIIDDSPEDRILYRRYLLGDREFPYILEADSGQQGLDLWCEHQPDVVLVSHHLPDMDSLEFCHQLKRSSSEFSLPVIVLTEQSNETVAVQVMKAGAQDYLVKDQVTPESLSLAVDGAIDASEFRTQLQQRIEHERLVSQIVQKIQQTLEIDDILQMVVQEIRQFLQTDRVVFFQLELDGNGHVVAESVGSGWPSLFSMEIHDSCLAANVLNQKRAESLNLDPVFTEDYVKRYRQGQVTAIADIHNANINPCYVELLERFQVKANLVVPILHNDQCWGLLIAHHCAAPRPWQPSQIKLLQKLASPVSVALRQAELYHHAQCELAERQQIEAELRKSEERYAALAQISPVGIFRTDASGDCLYVNARWCELAGLSPEQARGRDWIKAIHLDDRERVIAEWYQAATLNLPFYSEYRFQTPAGVVSWLIGQAIAETNTEGEVIGYVGTVTDITARKQVEGTLKRSEEFKNRLLESSPDCIKVLDIEGRLLYMNAGGMRMMEIDDLTPYLHQEWVCFWGDEHRPQAEQALKTAIKGEASVFRGFCPTAKGTPKWWEVIVSPIPGTSGQTEQLLSVSRDITERKQSELRLQESEKRLQLGMQVSGFALAQINYLTDTVHLSPEAATLYGLSADQRVVSREQIHATFHPDDRARLEQHMQALFDPADSGWFAQDHRILRNNGEVKWLTVRKQVFFDRSSSPPRASHGILVALDITDRKQAEMERDRLLKQEQAARIEAERANRIKDEFLAVLSHELRSPLNPILGWAKLLQSRKFDAAKTAEALATIERNAKLQTQLIDDLLDVAKILRGKLVIETAPVDLAFVIEAAIETMRAAAVAKSIRLHSELPQIGRISGDSARLQQVVWNLLSNAIKFTPAHGQVDILLERVGPQAQVTVSDTGKGINSDFLPHLFDSFRQEDASTTRTYGGLGLGLAIVRSLVEAHGGTITAHSPGEGQGATFTIRFPLFDVEPEAQPSPQQPGQALDLTGIRVLAVDDEPDARDLITMVLTVYGAEVLTVTSAAEVLTALESFQPDVLVSDIGMPDVDGYGLIRQIRALPPEQGGQIPAIALTAYAREEDYKRAIASGFQQQLTKPLEPEQLVQGVVTLVCRLD